METDTIFAVSSGSLPAGVALIRVSGPDADTIFPVLGVAAPLPRRLSRRRLRDPETGGLLDDALVVRFEAPASFTGDPTVELHLHGSVGVVARVHAVLVERAGFRPALPGEFSRRAFENGRLDLPEVEALGDLISAITEQERRQALRGLSDGLGTLADRWRTDLTRLMARIEAQIDFSDEGDVRTTDDADLSVGIRSIAADVQATLADGDRGVLIRDGLTIVLAGAPNTGKSSLLNRLAHSDLAIVTDRPGTTRDPVQATLVLGGVRVVVIDTAGLRETDDPIEQEGIRRARARVEEADLVLWVSSHDVPDSVQSRISSHGFDSPPVWLVRNKIDSDPDCLMVRTVLVTGRPDASPAFDVSVHSGFGLDELEAALANFAATLTRGEPTLVTRERHKACLQATSDALKRSLERLTPVTLELAAEDLRIAARHLAVLSGRIDVEDVLDDLFRTFCIGK
jgi:tRNA modification GTPase